MSNGAGQMIHRTEPGPGRFRCLECSQTFGRIEHLTRHSRSHSKERYLKCSYCHKGFYRGDALRRHEQVHKEPNRSTLGRGIRACLACAKARRKCSGENPCFACNKRSIGCHYPQSSNTKDTSRGENLNEESMVTSDDRTTAPSNGQDREVSQLITSPRESSALWSDMSHSPAAVDERQTQLNSETSQHHYESKEDVMTGIDMETPNFHIPSSATQRSMQRQLALGSHHNNLDSAADVPVATPLPSFLRDPVIDFQRGVGSAARQTWPSSGSAPQSMNVGPSTILSNIEDRTAEPNFWSQNNVSSINWLPDNWIPDFQFGAGEPAPLRNFAGPKKPSQDRSMSIPDTGGSNISQLNGSTPPFNSSHGIASPETIDSNGVGYYYVDGDGARLPRIRRAPHRSPHHSSDPYTPLSGSDGLDHAQTKFGFPAAESRTQDDSVVSTPTLKRIQAETYSEISRVFSQTCITSTYFSPFHTSDFPSLEALSHFVRLYIENFQPILPFIHPATFSLSSSHWLLLLAMAAIGSHYSGFEDVEALVLAMHEFLRRAISMMLEMDANSIPEELVLTQVRLLSCIGMMYCGDQRLVERAKNCMSDLITFCNIEWPNYMRGHRRTFSGTSNQVASDWERWCQAESHRRTGYSIWLLDCMWSFQFQLRPLLSLEDAKVPVPCQEVLWEADSALDWQQLFDVSIQSPSLHEVVQILYVEKRLQSSMGEFSRILCIHALFRRTWEVEAYFKQPLTLWSPAAEKQDIKSKETSSPVWLPCIQTYSRWRNSACDCLDILHWHANSVIGAASGMEHPTVLHLHLARVVLLTPFRHIVQLAQLMTKENEQKNDPEIAETRSLIRRWAMEDQHKARLAMIHAGVLFWHVRRYSTDGFYEPSSVFLATLALWAYGTFAQNTSGPAGEGQSPQGEDDAESIFPTSIQLDRPADDELVQLFVKRGGQMRANITGVGNVCSARGPGRVLSEGRKLLVDLKFWSYSRRLIRKLAVLAEVCQREHAT